MNFTHQSWCWRIAKCTTKPEVLLRSLIEAVVADLPANSLGHIKGYVDFDSGTVFASSTLVPPGVTLDQRGEYHQGAMQIHLTMIFYNLSQAVMAKALALAVEETQQHWDCRMREVKGNGQWRLGKSVASPWEGHLEKPPPC